MTALNFKTRFCLPCIERTKGGTIRDDRKDGRLIKPGGMIQFYTAMRTSQCQKIMPDLPALEVQRIEVDFTIKAVVFPSVTLGGTIHRTGRLILVGPKLLDAFAGFDGFHSFSDMEEFWREGRGKAFRPEYSGNHIRWLPWPKPIAELLG